MAQGTALFAAFCLSACTRPQPAPTREHAAEAPSVAPSVVVPASPAEPAAALRCLAAHYPAAQIVADGLQIGATRVPLDDGVARTGEDRLDHADVRDVLEPAYPAGAPVTPATSDPGRARLEALFAATYPDPARHLAAVKLAGTTVRVHERVAPALARVAARLEPLLSAQPTLRAYFEQMGGTYNDRVIAGTERKSAHAYGIAIDIGTAQSDYWRNAAGATAEAPPAWRNRIPAAIVAAFEAEQFVWGGRWQHYDTMHFEWRPELFDPACRDDAPMAVASYGWTGQPGALDAVDTLTTRLAPPPGFHLRAVAPGSFEAYLGGLPLAAKGTPVKSYRGDVIVAGDDPRVVAVTTLDVGTRDLQQCADALLRLHAEYKFAANDDAALSYRAASKFPMPFSRWITGERLVAKGNDLAWAPARGATGRTHANLRSWLDTVFNYANTVSIQRDASVVSRADVRAGDFFVQGGWPGHAVLVLAVAENAAGEKRALLGQSYMPAQSFQVLAQNGDPWFSLQGDEIATPFWRPFGWADLRRMP